MEYQPRPLFYQTGELVPPGTAAPTFEDIKAHPERYPMYTIPTEEEELRLAQWLREQDQKPDLCQTVVRTITCALDRHHDGACSETRPK